MCVSVCLLSDKAFRQFSNPGSSRGLRYTAELDENSPGLCSRVVQTQVFALNVPEACESSKVSEGCKNCQKMFTCEILHYLVFTMSFIVVRFVVCFFSHIPYRLTFLLPVPTWKDKLKVFVMKLYRCGRHAVLFFFFFFTCNCEFAVWCEDFGGLFGFSSSWDWSVLQHRR